MRCITLTQPWATLVAIGAKRIETRSWATTYRGPLAIHAAKGLGPVGGKRGLHQLVRNRPFCDVLFEPLGCTDSLQVCEKLPLGAIVATCELIDCVQVLYEWPHNQVVSMTSRHCLTDQERAFDDYTPGRFAWLLANVKALPEPIVCKGALGLWNYEGEL